MVNIKNIILKNNPIELIILMISLFILCGGIVYYFYALNSLGTIISLLLTLFAFVIILFFYHKSNIFKEKEYLINTNEKIATLKENIIFISLYLTFFIITLIILYVNRSANAINSPWTELPAYFFVFYFFTTAILIGAIIKKINFSIILISLHYFLTFSIALIIYKIGYGFDPFVHQATMDLIDKKGFVNPKPFYYLGQYSLIIIIHKITYLPIAFLNKILVPLLSAILLPITLFKLLNKWMDSKIISKLTILGIMIIPCPLFIVTTPQNLAYLFLILTIIYGFLCSNILELIFVSILALTSIIIHPIAGIPAIIFVLAILIYHSEWKYRLKSIFLAFLFLVSSLALPSAFYFLENKNLNIIGLLKNINIKLSPLKELITFHNPIQENFILNFIHFYSQNLGLIILELFLGGLILFIFNFKKCKIFTLSLLMSISLFISYLISQNLKFSYLINYERGVFANRILIISLIFLLPFFLLIIYWIIQQILKQEKITKIILIIFFIILITTSFYNTYPRSDRYANSHGYAVSQNDLDAVQWIEDNADGDYIVLANQQVSAASLKIFGFSKYYQNDIFFYPVPTSGALYQYYLDMVYKTPSKETALKAMDLAGVNEAYFVLNKYWWAFPKILAEAKLSADSWTKHGDGEIYIFKFTR